MTLVESAAALAVSSLIVGILFSLGLTLVKQQQGTAAYNEAKRTVLFVSDTLAAKIQNATRIDYSRTSTSVTLTLDTGVVFTLTQNSGNPTYWDVVYQGPDGRRTLGTVGFSMEDPNGQGGTTDHLVLTLWQSYEDDTGREQKYVLTSGFHVSVAS